MRLNTKLIFAALASILCIGNAHAQNFERGVDFYNVGMYSTAKAYLVTTTAKDATAESYYYLGDTYLMLGKADSASIFFAKSSELDPNFSLAEVGKGKVKLYNKDIAGATDIFKQISKKDKKNADVFTAIASAYGIYGMPAEAEAYINGAYKIKKNYPKAYVIEGDNLIAEKKYSESLAKYEQAVYFDPNNKNALFKTAKAYMNVNETEAVERFNQILASEPNYLPALIELAGHYFSRGNFAKSVEYFEKIQDVPGISIEYKQNYAGALYFTQQNDKSLEVAQSILDKDPNNFVARRIKMYNLFATKKMDDALAKAKEFFASKAKDDKYIDIDYQIYGALLENAKDYPMAAQIYEKLIDMDSTKIDLLKNIAKTFENSEEYDNAIAYYKRYMDKTKEPTALDYYNYGRIFYQAASKAKTENNTNAQMAYLKEAINMFDSVSMINPDNYLGFIWKARSIASTDPEFKSGPAKEAYEITVEKVIAMNEDGKLNATLSECYSYLGNYYYAIAKDNKAALPYFEKMVELDPSNTKLIDFIKTYLNK